MEDISEFLKKREAEGSLRRLNAASWRRNGKICVNGREYIDFSSNDYLGLANHPRLIERAKKALDEFGASSSASRLLSGDLELHHCLEEAVAGFKGKEASLVFNSGYQANVGIFACLCTKDDCVFSDRLNHASVVDGILLSNAKVFRYNHNDMGHLESLMRSQRDKYRRALVVTETIFSMDGDRASLKELVELKKRYDCGIMVDEAHATGIFGPGGSGVVEEEGLTEEIDLIMGTFGKALGGFGAYIAGSGEMVEYLINKCRSFIYSTSLPPSVIASDLAGIEMVREEGSRRDKVLELARCFREALKKKGCAVKGCSQIVPVIVGENLKAVKAAKVLQSKGYWVLPIRPPTVPRGEARLRFSLSADHESGVLERLAYDVSEALV